MKTVKDVMSALPISVHETMSFREIAARLRECRVSAFPVLNADGKVIGVVSEADLLVKEAMADEPNVIWGLLAGIVHHVGRAKAAGVMAADLMTSPAVTIGPDETVEHAARLMYDRKVKRLPVVDQAGRLVGIVSRTDVLAIFDRPDAEIREEIMIQVIAGRSEPSSPPCHQGAASPGGLSARKQAMYSAPNEAGKTTTIRLLRAPMTNVPGAKDSYP
jgi:CBS domain-containing protein